MFVSHLLLEGTLLRLVGGAGPWDHSPESNLIFFIWKFSFKHEKQINTENKEQGEKRKGVLIRNSLSMMITRVAF